MVKSTIYSITLISVIILLIGQVFSAPESVSNLDQYATDSKSGHKPKITVYYPNMETQDILVEDLEDFNQSLMDKKGASWNKLQGVWGKRGSNSWNRLSGGWGKRGGSGNGNGDRDWNQLSGMWGKRGGSGQPGQWNNLSGMWGKRGPPVSGSPGQWNNLSGMWGKRGWNDLNGQWGKRDSPHWNNLRGMWGKRSVSEENSV